MCLPAECQIMWGRNNRIAKRKNEYTIVVESSRYVQNGQT